MNSNCTYPYSPQRVMLYMNIIILVLINIVVDVQTLVPYHTRTSFINSHKNSINFAFSKHHEFGHPKRSSFPTKNNDYHSNLHRRNHVLSSTVPLFMGKKSTEHLLSRQWLPSIDKSDDDIFASDVQREQLENESIEYVTALIRDKLQSLKNEDKSSQRDEMNFTENDDTDETIVNGVRKNNDSNYVMELVKGRFRDLTCKEEGEKILENLLINNPPDDTIESDKKDVVRAAVIALQSLLIMGMQVGVKGSTEYQKKLVSHLYERSDISISSSPSQPSLDVYFDTLTSRQLKHQMDTTAGTQILSALKRKRSTQSAYDLLVQLGIWEKHEDIVLLRSGFPLRFTEEELDAAVEAEYGQMASNGTRIENVDPDQLLGLRRDLRSMKVYTIDSKYTNEIDDGLSIEKLTKPDGNQRHRVWIHIADADKWAPRSSKIFEAAQCRATSVYTPTGSISMFPPNLSSGAMSLRADRDSYALSLGVEINDDGSIDENSIIVTPSIIKVDYRLTYDEVDEMLEMGIGYFEEWELGAMLSEANKRRNFRIENGSTEGFVPMPIPQADIRVESKEDAEDGIDIILKVEASHNAGLNQSSSLLDTNPANVDEFAPPVSSSFLLVTEMMIMSGEAMGKFKSTVENLSTRNKFGSSDNKLNLPFRTQAKPDFSQRYQELNTLASLKERGYCHAWYARRFFQPVKVLKEAKPHYGLGLDCYVQWSSPIRRFGDLQVHAAVKRYLRRKRVNQLLEEGKPIPSGITELDLGCSIPASITSNEDGKKLRRPSKNLEINYDRGLGYVKAARMVQKKTNEYWMFEYIRRLMETNKNDLEFEATVLACIDPERFQYAIYVNELGLEHRYLSQKGYLQTGSKLLMKVDSVSPRHGLLTLTLSSKYIGRKNNSIIR